MRRLVLLGFGLVACGGGEGARAPQQGAPIPAPITVPPVAPSAWQMQLLGTAPTRITTEHFVPTYIADCYDGKIELNDRDPLFRGWTRQERLAAPDISDAHTVVCIDSGATTSHELPKSATRLPSGVVATDKGDFLLPTGELVIARGKAIESTRRILSASSAFGPPLPLAAGIARWDYDTENSCFRFRVRWMLDDADHTLYEWRRHAPPCTGNGLTHDTKFEFRYREVDQWNSGDDAFAVAKPEAAIAR